MDRVNFDRNASHVKYFKQILLQNRVERVQSFKQINSLSSSVCHGNLILLTFEAAMQLCVRILGPFVYGTTHGNCQNESKGC